MSLANYDEYPYENTMSYLQRQRSHYPIMHMYAEAGGLSLKVRECAWWLGAKPTPFTEAELTLLCLRYNLVLES